MKVLIVRFSSIGDVVLTTPVIRCIHNQKKDVEVHYFTKSSYRSILENNPYIHKLWLLDDNNWDDLIAMMKEEKFSKIIDLHNNLRTLKLQLALGVHTYRVNKINIQKWLYTNLKINLLPKVHIVDRYLQAAGVLRVQNDGQGLDYFISDDTAVPEEINLPSAYICVAIGGQHETKKLPTTKLSELCNKISQSVVLIGGPEDQEAGEFIAGSNPNVMNLCGKLSINQSALVIQRSGAVITHDTGMMHIAAAYEKHIFSIWGNTVPRFGMTPYKAGDKSHIFEVEGLSCRPCSKIGFEKCPKGHFKCMKNQDLNAVAERLERLDIG